MRFATRLLCVTLLLISVSAYAVNNRPEAPSATAVKTAAAVKAESKIPTLMKRDVQDRYYRCYPSTVPEGTTLVDPSIGNIIQLPIPTPAPAAAGAGAVGVPAASGVTGQEPRTSPPIRCTYGFLTRKEVLDLFGHWVADHYAVAEVNVENIKPRIHFMVQEAALLNVDNNGIRSKLKAVDRTTVRNVAEVRKLNDPKQFWIRQITNIGSILGSATLTLPEAVKDANNIFNGPFKSAVQQQWPDNTLNEIKHIDDFGFVPDVQTEDHKTLKFDVFFNRAAVEENYKEKTSLQSVLGQTRSQTQKDVDFYKELWRSSVIALAGEQLEVLKPTGFFSFDQTSGKSVISATGDQLNLVKTIVLRSGTGTSYPVPFAADGETKGSAKFPDDLKVPDGDYNLDLLLTDGSTSSLPMKVTVANPKASQPVEKRAVWLGKGPLVGGQSAQLFFQLRGVATEAGITAVAVNPVDSSAPLQIALQSVDGSDGVFFGVLESDAALPSGVYTWEVHVPSVAARIKTGAFFESKPPKAVVAKGKTPQPVKPASAKSKVVQ